jgi:hypothetical protein
MLRNYKVESILVAIIYNHKGVTPYNLYKLAEQLNVDYDNLTELAHHARNYNEYFNTPFTPKEGGIL